MKSLNIKTDMANMPRHWVLLLLVILPLFTFCVNNAVLPVDIMECRNLATAREMVEYSNYLAPTLNGTLRIEKPPLPTWGAAAIEYIAPNTLVFQRLLSALMAWVLMWFVFLIGKEITNSKRIGFVMATVLATSYSVMIMARSATWDIWSHALMTGGVYFYLSATIREGKQWGWFCLAGVFFALSFLSKGPVAFYSLLLPFLITYHWVYRPSMKHKKQSLTTMLLLTLTIGGGWYIYLFFVEQNGFMSVVCKETRSWTSYNVRPWWYYHLFFAEAGIWGVCWLSALVHVLLSPSLRRNKLLLLGVYWTFMALFLLSIVPEKKIRYLLPLMVPCAITVGSYLVEWHKTSFILKLNAKLVGLLGLIASLLLIYSWYAVDNVSTELIIPTILIFLFLSVLTFRIQTIYSFLITFSLFMIAGSSFGIPLVQSFIVNPERHSIQAILKQPQIKNHPAFYPAVEKLRPEIMYSLRRSIQPIDCGTDFSKMPARPFLLITSLPLDSLSRSMPEGISVDFIGHFDDNWKMKRSKQYNPNLCKDVWLFK